MQIHAQAHAKINWSLNITGRRENGYHELDMLMQSIELCDDMTFADADSLTLTVDGAPADDSNLVLKAARALNRLTGQNNGAAMTLQKRIPARAGLGGGSADCALTLKALNRLWGLNLTQARLMDLGATLGADVPFCLTGGLAHVTGIGERVSPLPASPRIPLVLVTPGGGLSTGEVFALWDRGGFPPVRLDNRALARTVMHKDLPAVQKRCANALTAPAIRLLPEIGALLNAFHAPAVFMTGSGSTVVAAWPDEARAQSAAERIPGAILTFTR